jgi:hypothetical protein
MSSVDLAERDQQLVALLRQDKSAFLREYRRVMHIPDDAALTGLLDRDMVCAILDQEFPARTACPQTVPE